MPVTSRPRRIRVVTPANAASVVMPSNASPGTSPYMGWKWSKPHAPSKPRSSASCTRLTTSSHGSRCCATSSPKRITILRPHCTKRRSRSGQCSRPRPEAVYLPTRDEPLGAGAAELIVVPNAKDQRLVAALGVTEMTGDEVGLRGCRVTVDRDDLVADGVHRDTEPGDAGEEPLEVLVADAGVAGARDECVGGEAAAHLLPIPVVDATGVAEHHVPHRTFVDQPRDRLLHCAGL